MVKKILKAQRYFEEAGWTEEELLSWTSFSAKQMYLKLRGDFLEVDWRRLLCNNAAPPKWAFILY